MYAPGSLVYMDKIAVGPEARGVIDINAPVDVNLKAIARAKGRDVNDLTVIILDRPRHAALIEKVRQVGARIRLISDGDVSAASAPRRRNRHRRAPGHRRLARGRDHRGGAEMPGRRDPVQAMAAR